MASSKISLTADYATPETQHRFEQSLPALPQVNSGTRTDEKTAYLAALRTATIQMQSQVNAFLTDKMEDDKRKDASIGKASGRAVNDEKAEEMYGEEAEDEG